MGRYCHGCEFWCGGGGYVVGGGCLVVGGGTPLQSTPEQRVIFSYCRNSLTVMWRRNLLEILFFLSIEKVKSLTM